MASTGVITGNAELDKKIAEGAAKAKEFEYEPFPEETQKEILAGKTVVITGANRGIGLAIAERVGALGGKVYGAVRKASPELIAALNGGRIISDIDVLSDDCGTKLAAGLKEAGVTQIDFLVNNSGILTMEKFGGDDWAAIRKQFEVNTLGPLKITFAMHAAGLLKEGARGFTISSLMGSCADNGSGGMYGYRMSKAAANMASVSLAMDLKKEGITYQILHPGFVATDMTAAFGGGMPAGECAALLTEQMAKAQLEHAGKYLSRHGKEELF